MDKEVKKFFVRAAIFFLPLILIFTVLEFYARSLPTSYSLKKDYLLEISQEAEILVLGSSRAFFGINPDYFSRLGFNLANVAQTFFYDKELIVGNLEAFPALRCVLIETSDFSLGYQLADSPAEWRDYYYWHFWGIKYPGLEKDSRFFSRVMLFTPNKIFDFLLGGAPALEISKRGWQPFEGLNILAEENARQRVFNNQEIVKDDNYLENIGYLNELLSVLEKRGIRAAVASAPVHRNYSRFVDPAISRKNSEVWENLCDEGRCRVFDFAADSRFGDDDFADSDHLNPAGAEKFSRILDKEVFSEVCY